MSLCFSVLLSMITTFSVPASPERDAVSSFTSKTEWQIVKTDKNNPASWVIAMRKLDGTNFYEYKIEGEVAASPAACLAAFKQELYAQANDPHNKKYPTYTISDESEKGLLTYVIHKEPFPLKNTEMSVRYEFVADADGGLGVKWQEAWDECPVSPSKKLKRVEAFRGAWYFSPLAGERSQAINSVQFDPKKMPLWLAEPMVFKFLIEGLENIGKS